MLVLHKLDFVGNRWIELDDYHPRLVAHNGLPYMVIVAINIHAQEVEVLGDGRVCKNVVQGSWRIRSYECVEHMNGAVLLIPLPQHLKTFWVCLNQHCGKLVFLNKVSRVA